MCFFSYNQRFLKLIIPNYVKTFQLINTCMSLLLYICTKISNITLTITSITVKSFVSVFIRIFSVCNVQYTEKKMCSNK